MAAARRDEQSQLRELAEQAHGVNLDLGASLLKGLSSVDATSLDVCRVYVYGLIGADCDGSGYTQTGERVARLAAAGIRLVLDEFRADVTKTKKDGSRGKLRIDYGDAREPEAAIKWIWRYLDGAKTAGDLFWVVVSLSLRRSSTRRGWSCLRANGRRRSGGARIRTSPRRP